MNVLIKTGQTQPVECVGGLVGWSCFSLFVQMSELGLFVVVIARRLCFVVLLFCPWGLVIACSQFVRLLSRLGPVQCEIITEEGSQTLVRHDLLPIREILFSRLGPVQCEIFHKGGQPDICFPRQFFSRMMTRSKGCRSASNLLPIREILFPHVWGQSFRRASCGICSRLFVFLEVCKIS